jgi:hypothetical protein
MASLVRLFRTYSLVGSRRESITDTQGGMGGMMNPMMMVRRPQAINLRTAKLTFRVAWVA